MNINKKVAYIIFIIVVVICGILYTTFDYNTGGKVNTNIIEKKDDDKNNSNNENKKSENNLGNKLEVNKKNIKVYICGEVIHEGVYKLEEGARVCDALKLAGGLKESAAKTIINLARYLVDGEMIYFPSKNEVESGKYSIASKNSLININYGTKDELMTLPGIGEAKADDIINYRESNGLFDNIEDIKQVDGIKEALYGKIKDLITI
jgi:competence protein ComEA